MIIGSHVEYKKESGLKGSVQQALSFGETAFMFYTGAPQNTKRCEVDVNLTNDGQVLMMENGIDINNVIVHAPYIVNLANKDNYEFNVSFLRSELERVNKLGVTKVVLHPGSHVGRGIIEGSKTIIDALNDSLNENSPVILLETMAGKGSEIGSNFEELKFLIDGVILKNKIGVCMDTCHINDAGYDVTNFDKILDEFDKVIGLDKLMCIHINDSKNEKGSHKDRHENIGYGTIGFDNMINIIYNERIKDIPKILETPYINEMPPYKEEIESILTKKYNSNLK